MRKVLVIAVCVLICSMFLVSCAESKNLMKPFNKKKEEKKNVSEYIELGQYLGIDVPLVEPEVITEDMVDMIIKESLYNYAETEEVDRAVEDGDIVIGDYTGYVDGKTSSSLQSSGEKIIIGLGQYLKEFEAGFIGMKAGESKSIKFVFPEDYAPDMAGKEVTFEITVHNVYQAELPELTDEFVKENMGYESVSAYRQTVEESLENTAQSNAESSQAQEIWEAVRANTKVLKYPEDEIEEYVKDYTSYYESMASYSGVSFEEYLLSYYGITAEQFVEDVTDWAKDDIVTKLIIRAIVEKEGITLTEEEYQEAMADLVQQYGITPEQFTEYYGQTVEEYYGKENIEMNVLSDKVYDLIFNNAHFV